MGWEELLARELPRIPGTSYLLDLTDSTDEKPSTDFGEDLIKDAPRGREEGVFLVVLVTPDVWTECSFVTKSNTPILRLATAAEIAKRLLIVKHQLNDVDDWLMDERINNILSGIEHPGDAMRLADAISLNFRRHDKEKAKLEVLDEFKNWSSHLSIWFSEHPQQADRAALISAAVLDPGLPAAIMDARNGLLDEIGEAIENPGPLSGPGRTGYLQLLGAVETPHGFSISANKHKLDEAVIPFVWAEWPQMKTPIQSWLLKLASSRVQPGIIERVSSLMVQTASRNNSTAYMELVRKIIVDNAGIRELAFSIVDNAVLDPAAGAKVRQRLLRWAASNTESLALFVAESCGRALGRERPSLAVRRICRVLSRTNTDRATHAAAISLLNLADNESTRSAVFDTVCSMFAAQKEEAVSAFLTLASGSRSFVGTCLTGEVGADELEFFEVGWEITVQLQPEDPRTSSSMRTFLNFCENLLVAPNIVDRILGPILANSLNKILAMEVLSGPEPGNPEAPQQVGIRNHLIKELIWGQLNRKFEY
ncbi:hypothetical protein [Actinoplanes derwentensis]|nr:hypothetical protein [Actinoplanes derwentensis]GID87671.1 hypothetical protein Ade03nite_65950 [Actinoplanes derwentensis]